MKKYMICFVSALVLGFSSCDLMDLKPLDQLSEEDVWNDEELLQLYVNGCYNALQHGYRYTDMMGIYCDEMYTRSNDGRVVEYLAGTMDADNITGMGILNYWSTAYSYIRKINTFLEKAEAGSVPEEVKRPMIGEMKFIRAYIYAELIWRYGGVPIIEKVYGLNDDFGVERASYDKCVEFIRNELIEAQRMLPEQQPASEQGRASGDACQALLARVLLYWASPLNNPTNDRQRWTDAANAAWALIDKRYRLIDDYGDVFLSWNDEVIFARAFSQANSTEFATWAGRSGDNGQGVITPTQNMVNAYEMQATGLRPYVEQADGTLTLNAGSGYDPANPYAGRDPRFYASVLYDADGVLSAQIPRRVDSAHRIERQDDLAMDFHALCGGVAQLRRGEIRGRRRTDGTVLPQTGASAAGREHARGHGFGRCAPGAHPQRAARGTGLRAPPFLRRAPVEGRRADRNVPVAEDGHHEGRDQRD